MASAFGDPVAQNVNTGNGLQTLSGLMDLQSKRIGIQQQQQALETGQSTQASARAKATIDTQTAQENQNLAKIMQDPIAAGVIDSEGNPTADGESILLKAAPTTGADKYGELVKAARSKLDFNAALGTLNSQQRNEVGSVLGGAASGARSLQDIQSAADQLRESKKGTPLEGSYNKLIDAAMHAITQAGDPLARKVSFEQQRHAALNGARALLTPQSVVGPGGVASGTQGIMNSGASQQPGTFAPALEGGAFTPSGPATQTQIPPGYTMVNGQLVRADNSGLSLPPVRAPGGAAPAATASGAKLQPIQAPTVNANPGDVARYNATMEENRKHVQDVSSAANDLQNGVGPTRYRNDQIQDILNSKYFSPTGPGAAQLNWISSKLPGESGDAYQKIGHYLAQNSAAIAQKMGVPGTNMGAEQAAAASGNTSQNRGALLEITKVNDAMNTALDMYNRGLAKATNNGADPSKVSAYRQAFGQNFDMNVLRYDDALRRGDKAEIDRIVKDEGPAGMKAMAQSRKVLHSLADTGDLP